MKYLIGLFFLLNTTLSFNQKVLKDIHLKRSLKQDGEQYQFTVLDKDKKGVRHYKKTLFYYWYKAQHVISTQGASSGDLLHGEFEAHYENKQLSKKGWFQKGLKNGEWLYWRTDGTLIKSEHWKKGKLKGIETDYDVHGEVIQTTKHRYFSYKRENPDTILVGKKLTHSETLYIKDSLGRISRIEEKKNGLLHGTVKELENGKVVEKTTYKKGEPVIKEKKVKGEPEGESTGKEKKWKFPGKKNTASDEGADSGKKVKKEKPQKEKKETERTDTETGKKKK